jgi:shikimate kinase
LKKVSLPNGNNNIFITGFMGSGKTTVGKALARKLNRKFIDLDAAIEEYLDQKIYDVIEKFGIEYFRKIENQQLALLCKEKEAVISLGGGSLIAPKNQAQIKKSGTLIHLWANEKTLMNRLEKSYTRPLLKSGKGLKELYEERIPGYQQANICVRTDDLSPEEISENIIHELKGLE